ncbi:MAG: hypothetical protein LAN83_04010 [Acidobacteriia bacterium]|nr:hypothetical protein [Terriglobia bacterium]
MNIAESISTGQIQKLQVLWGQYFRLCTLDFAGIESREARLRWAGELLGHPVSSFKELSRQEANVAIDALQRVVERRPENSISRQDGADRGLQGRRRRPRGPRHFVMASKEDQQRIQSAIARLGWTQERFEKWLASRTSPLRGRTAIHSLADANQVWWALKGMLKRAGKWDASPAGTSSETGIARGAETVISSRQEGRHAQ